MVSFLLAAAVAIVAWRLRWLTPDGAIAATVVGGAILEFGGLWWAGALVAFFVSGTLLTLVGRGRKTQPEHRGRGRTAGQVLGTGGVAALISVAWSVDAVPAVVRALLPAAFLGAVAASAADTWATELGMLSRRPPRLITTWAEVAAGTSGGVTLVGSLAGVAGAAFIAAIGSLVRPGAFIAATIAGSAAMSLDSLLGATVQASFRRADGGVTEDAERSAALIRGARWMTNSVVNLLATAVGALVAAAVAYGR
jgi:uncharacterized protein (TIGR00297 family)